MVAGASHLAIWPGSVSAFQTVGTGWSKMRSKRTPKLLPRRKKVPSLWERVKLFSGIKSVLLPQIYETFWFHKIRDKKTGSKNRRKKQSEREIPARNFMGYER